MESYQKFYIAYFSCCGTLITLIAQVRSYIHFLLITATISHISNGQQQKRIGAVSTNGPPCAKIGTSVLEKGGTAVDAAIAALFCEGVSVPNCMGLGGGFLMNIYINSTRKSDFLVSREVAPKNATRDMYGSNETLAIKGGLAVAVPGELKGYWEAHQKYGRLKWKELVQPTIELCEEGIPVTKYMENVYKSFEDVIRRDPVLNDTFVKKDNNELYVEHEYVKRPRLAKTLKLVAEFGASALYNGSLTEGFVEDIQRLGGVITREDLTDYRPKWTEPLEIDLPFNQTLYTSPLPGSGTIVGLIINILSNFLDLSQPFSIRNWQRIIESFKFGFAKRTQLGDPDFVNITKLTDILMSKTLAQEIRQIIFDNQTFDDPVYYGANVTQPDDHGTANLCIVAPNGDAVAVTSTINLDFGAGFMSDTTGIILNNQMDDFSSPGFKNNYGVPPSPNNYIEPGKRPISSMNPSIVVDDEGNVRLVVGGSGGTKIITSVALTLIRHLWFNETIKHVVSEKRLHHQLYPMEILYEDQFSKEILDGLLKIGHNCTLKSSNGFNTVTAIAVANGSLQASCDPRRGGGEEYVLTSQAFSSVQSSLTVVACMCIISTVFKHLDIN